MGTSDHPQRSTGSERFAHPFWAFLSFAFRVLAFAAALEALVAIARRSSGVSFLALVWPPMRPSSAAAFLWASVRRSAGIFFISSEAIIGGKVMQAPYLA
jgi:hypothetical protein